MLRLFLLSLLLTDVGAESSGDGLWRLRTQLETEALPLFQFGRELSAQLEEDKREAGGVEATSLLECEVVFNDYIGRLRDHYAAMFAREAQDLAGKELVVRRDFYLKECRIAMQAALPHHSCCAAWKFDGALVELQGDLDQVLHHESYAAGSLSTLADADADADPSSVAASRLSSAPRFGIGTLRQKWRANKRLRWIVAQSLLLLANFCQSEWVRCTYSQKKLILRRTARHYGNQTGSLSRFPFPPRQHRRQSHRAAEKRLADVPEFPLL